MAYKSSISQQKFAEKLIILNDRAVGLLTRIYNIKKACGNAKYKPSFLNEKSLEGCIKHIVRKFPILDTRTNTTVYNQINSIKKEIIKSLSLYYRTFADLLDFKDHAMQLLATIDTAQLKLDITINYDVTTGYLNLLTNLICLMILLSQIDDRKAVLGLYNAAYEICNCQTEPTFPRLGQMIIDFETPLKKLAEEFGPLNRLPLAALTSLAQIYVRRNVTAGAWRSTQMLSLVVSPQQILYVAQTDTIACEYLSLDVMDRWIILISIVFHGSVLADSVVSNLWQRALQTGLAIRLFRDEILMVHQSVQTFFESIRGYNKKVQEVKDHYSVALQTSLIVHDDRRRFLRGALRELNLIIQDHVGLLGPKILFVWMALSFSRDEVLWLLRHTDIWPASGGKRNKSVESDIVDKQIPELLFLMHELRELVQKHSGVIQRYYSRYVHGYDAPMLTQMLQKLENLSDDESTLLSDFCADISNIQSNIDLRGLRLDWYRFQTYTSGSRASFSLFHEERFARAMNTTVFHLKMVDLVKETCREVSELSIYCFYSRHLETQLRLCLRLPSQSRYSMVFAHLCSHFEFALHDMCPEETKPINEKGLSLCNMVLDEIAKETTLVVSRLFDYHQVLEDELSPITCARLIRDRLNIQAGKLQSQNYDSPGSESYRDSRETLSLVDKLQTTLSELCTSIASCRQLTVAEHIFAPRTYLSAQLENQLTNALRTLADSGDHPMRPSELLSTLHVRMAVLQNIDSIVTLDTSGLLSNVLLQQGQLQDTSKADTLTSIYTKWYLDVVLRRMSTGPILLSPHLSSLIPNPDHAQSFSPEQYTNVQELRALSQVLGPCGIKFMSERLIWHVASQIKELYKIISEHLDVLRLARSSFDKPDKLKEILLILSGDAKDKKQPQSTLPVDAMLQRIIIIGAILSFRKLLHSALHDVLEQRIPFMVSRVDSLHALLNDSCKLSLSEMYAAFGIDIEIDAALINALRTQLQQTYSPDEHYNITCLLFTFIALSLPRLANPQQSQFNSNIAVSRSNASCIALSINSLANTLFFFHGRNDTFERMKEFLALSSMALLRVPDDSSDVEVLHNRQPVYIILDELIRQSSHLTYDLLESCFPYAVIRSAYQHSCRIAESL